MSKMADHSKDAWKQYSNLVAKYTHTTELRPDLVIEALAHERCVQINGVQHNVGTVREYIVLLEDACRFVEDHNPGWTTNKA